MSALPQKILEADPDQFRNQFNQTPFLCSHNLVNHPLFEIPRLVELTHQFVEMGKPENVVCLSSSGSPSRKFGEALQQHVKAEDAIASLADSDSVIFLKHIHLHPDYKILQEQVLLELEKLSSLPLRELMTRSIATIIVSSPNAITPYHVDADYNFLFQLSGEKKVYLFDPNDRSILTEQEIESFCAGNGQAATYRKENQCQAKVLDLSPGSVVHHPVLAPHWVQNGNNVSISLSINFRLESLQHQIEVYRSNYYLRRLKIKPEPPGKSPLRDRLKIIFFNRFLNPVLKNIRRSVKSTKLFVKRMKSNFLEYINP